MNTMTPTVIQVEPTMTCPSQIVQRAWSDQVQKQTETMTTGPHLAEDGHTLIVPSEWYNEQATKFWKLHGFRWNPSAATWERDTSLPLRKDAKRYTASAWLESTRREFYRFWPTLKKTCYYCRRKFIPRSIHQFTCPSCEAATDTERNYRRGLK